MSSNSKFYPNFKILNPFCEIGVFIGNLFEVLHFLKDKISNLAKIIFSEILENMGNLLNLRNAFKRGNFSEIYPNKEYFRNFLKFGKFFEILKISWDFLKFRVFENLKCFCNPNPEFLNIFWRKIQRNIFKMLRFWNYS